VVALVTSSPGLFTRYSPGLRFFTSDFANFATFRPECDSQLLKPDEVTDADVLVAQLEEA